MNSVARDLLGFLEVGEILLQLLMSITDLIFLTWSAAKIRLKQVKFKDANRTDQAPIHWLA
jgi:hypothetical protein